MHMKTLRLVHRKHCLSLPDEITPGNGGQVCIRVRQRYPGGEWGHEETGAPAATPSTPSLDISIFLWRGFKLYYS